MARVRIGDIVQINGKFAMVMPDYSASGMANDEDHFVQRLIFVDPFKKPERIIEGIVGVQEFNTTKWDVKVNIHCKARTVSRITESDYGFEFGGRIYHLPVPPKVPDGEIGAGTSFKSLTEGMNHFFVITKSSFYENTQRF